MKASELRTENWVKYNDYYCLVGSIIQPSPLENQKYSDKWLLDLNIDGVITVPLEDVEPIPLTEEWLVVLGCNNKTEHFGAVGEFNWYELPNGMPINWVLSSKCWIRIEGIDSVTIKYVHQLQNIYYVLTEEELKENK